MTSTYRDDRTALLASLETLRRENEDLRTENLALRVLVEPSPARSFFAQLQGALAATLILLGGVVGAALIARESHGGVRPAAPQEPALAVVALPDAPLPRALIPVPVTDEAPAPPTPLQDPWTPSAVALRVALAPLTPALARCLGEARGDFRLRVQLDADGVVTATALTPRGGRAVSDATNACVRDAARALRFDNDRALELRYTLRVERRGLRVRRARAR